MLRRLFAHDMLERRVCAKFNGSLDVSLASMGAPFFTGVSILAHHDSSFATEGRQIQHSTRQTTCAVGLLGFHLIQGEGNLLLFRDRINPISSGLITILLHDLSQVCATL